MRSGYRTEDATDRTHYGALIAAGTLLGIGLGGLIDGILLQQILQWHSMMSSVAPPTDLAAIEYNTFWGGVVYAFMWLIAAVGLALLWRAGEDRNVLWSTQTFAGSFVLGWGAFMVVEGIIAHHVLGVHHVNPGEYQVMWDIGYLLFGGLLMGGGWALMRAGRDDEAHGRVRHVPLVREGVATPVVREGAATPIAE